MYIYESQLPVQFHTASPHRTILDNCVLTKLTLLTTVQIFSRWADYKVF